MKYDKLYDLIKQEHIFEDGHTNLAAPENEELIERLKACVAEYEKNSIERKIYIFDILGNVKWFDSIDECAEFLEASPKSLSTCILKGVWAKYRWQVRRGYESVFAYEIKPSNFLKVERGSKVEISNIAKFAKQIKASRDRIKNCLKTGEKIKGWKVSKAELDVDKLIENGAIFDD